MEKPEAVPQKASRSDRVRSWLVALGPFVGAAPRVADPPLSHRGTIALAGIHWHSAWSRGREGDQSGTRGVIERPRDGCLWG